MSAVFTTAFFSNITSLSMLGSFYKDGLVKRRETTLSVLLNSFPSFFPHLPTTFFILIPLAGSAGAIYLSLLFVAALLRLITILTYTRLTLPVVEPPSVLDSKETPRARNWNRLLPETFGKVKSRLVRILAIVLPVYLIILAASEAGFFLWLRGFLARGIVGIAVPVEAMSVVIISLVAEATSGYAAAGAMMDAGTLSIFQTVLALLVGNIVATPVRVLRHQMPYYMGVFGPVSGFRLILASQAFRMASIICVGTVFILCAKIRI
jgi:hypothetical protein